LPNALSCYTTLFADDTCLLINGMNSVNLENKTNNEQNKEVQNLMIGNKLTINPTKSQILVLPHSQTRSNLDIKVMTDDQQ